MEEIIDKKRIYREFVKDYLTRRNIAETEATLIWLRSQKDQSRIVKEKGYKKVMLEIGVLDKLIAEAEEEER